MSQTKYTIHSNSLGFRGTKEYTKDKPESTYRIIVLGSYQAFGHGVEDNETYPAQLEAELNKTSTDNKFEVWNGGRHAAPAITGLARMTYEIFDYDPDLLILDYGFVDGYIWGDNTRCKDERKVCMVQRPPSILEWSMLWSTWRSGHRGKSQSRLTPDFKKTLDKMISIASEKGIPVVLVKQRYSISAEVYQELLRDGVYFIDVEEIFRNNLPEYPSPEEWDQGYWAKTWTAQFDPKWDMEKMGKEASRFRYYPYQLNFVQLNSIGQKVVAKGITKIIKEQVLPKEKSKQAGDGESGMRDGN
jgi:hypothetical protein